jgi:hypothetical protein
MRSGYTYRGGYTYRAGCICYTFLTVGVKNRCRCILVHIFSLVQAILLGPVGFERGLFLDAVGEIAAS